jgi:hypothetical protein
VFLIFVTSFLALVIIVVSLISTAYLLSSYLVTQRTLRTAKCRKGNSANFALPL